VLEGWQSPPGKRQYVRAALSRDGDGRYLVRPVGGHGSHLVADLARASALAVTEESVTTVAAGEAVRCLLLDEEAW
jgi:molybdopterin molybdotransferase